jgi:hypothetical protein
MSQVLLDNVGYLQVFIMHLLDLQIHWMWCWVKLCCQIHAKPYINICMNHPWTGHLLIIFLASCRTVHGFLCKQYVCIWFENVSMSCTKLYINFCMNQSQTGYLLIIVHVSCKTVQLLCMSTKLMQNCTTIFAWIIHELQLMF